MSSSSNQRPSRRSEARERLLDAATRLFYAEGIKAVGVDRIVSESRVTLATFYRQFPSKEQLVVAYLDRVHDTIVELVAAVVDESEGEERVRALGRAVIAELDQPGFRGCAFINAASEFESAEDPVRQTTAQHRRWYFDLARGAFAGAGHNRPGNAARHFLMVRDGAMSAGSLDSPTATKRTFHRGVEGLVSSIQVPALGGR